MFFVVVVAVAVVVVAVFFGADDDDADDKVDAFAFVVVDFVAFVVAVDFADAAFFFFVAVFCTRGTLLELAWAESLLERRSCMLIRISN